VKQNLAEIDNNGRCECHRSAFFRRRHGTLQGFLPVSAVPCCFISYGLPEAYRTRHHRRHGSASEDQVASVANKQIYLFRLSESFQIPFEDVDWSRRHCFIINDYGRLFWGSYKLICGPLQSLGSSV